MTSETWKKSLLIGCAAGLTIAAVAALVVGVIWWNSSKQQPWDTQAVTVVSVDEANQWFSSDFATGGYTVAFAVRNNTSRDLVIPTTTKVMRKLSQGGVLEDFQTASVETESFIPANLTAKAEIRIEWSCQSIGADLKVTDRDPVVCYNELVSGVSHLVMFDHTGRRMVEIPTPAMRQLKPVR